MFVVNLPQLNKSYRCKAGTPLMQFLLNHSIPIASSCKGDGVCGKCVVKIEGQLSIKSNTLENKLALKYKWNKKQRASCQVKVTSNITVTTSYW